MSIMSVQKREKKFKIEKKNSNLLNQLKSKMRIDANTIKKEANA